MSYKNFLSAALAALCVLKFAPAICAQTTYTWVTNVDSNWSSPQSWGVTGSPVAGDTAVFNNPVPAQPSDLLPSVVVNLADTQLGQVQSVQNLQFSSSNSVTNFRIGQTSSQTLQLAGTGGSTISRQGNANTNFIANVEMVGTDRSLTISNSSSTGSLDFGSLDIGESNPTTISVSAGTQTNIATLFGGANSSVTFSGNGVSAVTSISGVNTINVQEGTVGSGAAGLGATNVSGASTITLSGGSSTLNLQTESQVNITGGSHTLTSTSGSSVSLGDNGVVTGGLSIAGNGATLSGTGTINGNVVIGNGATHSPGNSPGLQTIAGNLTYEAGSTFVWELDGNSVDLGDFDQIQFDGTNWTLNVTGTMTTRLDFLNPAFNDAFWAEDRTWTVFSNVDVSSQSIANMGITFGAAGRPNGTLEWTFDNTNRNLNLQFFSAVPEPGTLALLGVATGIFGFAKRRRLKAMLSKPAA